MTSLARAALPVVAFVVAATVAGVAIFATVSNITFRPERTYNAVFSDVSGMRVGSDVEIAGVAVGRVDEVRRTENNDVAVAFTVRSELPVLVGSRALVRYKDLVGRRTLEVQQGDANTPVLDEGGTIPITQTQPALDLDELYNSFSPLFEGLQPTQVNELATTLVEVLQNQQGTVESLLAEVGSLTSTLADRDAVIGSVIDNLNVVLGTVNQRSGQTTMLIDQLQQLVTGLAQQRAVVGTALERTSDFTGSLQALLRDGRPAIAGDIAEIDRLSRVVNADEPALDTLLQRVPGYYDLVGRVGIYQSAFQFYLCGVQVRADASPLGAAVQTPMIQSQEARCRK